MQLINFSTRVNNILEAKKIYTYDDVARLFPKDYYDFREEQPLKESEVPILLKATLIYAEYKNKNKQYWQLRFKTKEAEYFNTFIFGYSPIAFDILINKDFAVCGTVQNTEWGYNVKPLKIELWGQFEKGIHTRYTKIKGISEKTFSEIIDASLNELNEPLNYLSASYVDAVRTLHKPISPENIKKAQNIVDYIDLVYFWANAEDKIVKTQCTTRYKITSSKWADDYIASQKFPLTCDQQSVYEDIKSNLLKGEKINALLQGDVGFGKTIIAVLCMLLMAENGYQSVLMAPTTVLAKQHFEELNAIAQKYGVKAVYLGSGKKDLTSLEDGSALFAIGTVGATSKDINFKNLGFVITDEEQKFGVKQRESLQDKTTSDTNVLSMSATPIPRTLFLSIFGEAIKVYELKTRPAGRSEIKTAINSNKNAIFKHIEKQIADGRQIYVVCPFIEPGEEGFENISSVEEIFEEYKKNLPNAKIVCATGKMKKDEIDELFSEFANGNADILVATSLVEVGINVPNAGTIIIHSCERFGLSTLHQLRGRIGRGKYEGYCILCPSPMDADKRQKVNSKLKILVDTTNGFKIAEFDLDMRKAGNLIGEEQSGRNKYVDLIVEKPKLFEKAKAYLKEFPEEKAKIKEYFEWQI